MAEYLWDKEGQCRAKTREQQHLCKLGSLDKFDDYCQFMKHDFSCQFSGKKLTIRVELLM